MSLIQHFAFRVKNYLKRIPKFFVADNPCAENMSRKNEDDANDLPNKRLCTEKPSQEEGKVIKDKKRQMAILLGYSGVNYWGMQRNDGVKTVEGELISALQKANFIPLDALADLHVINFQRAARTDKGVSAAKQVVSGKFSENVNVDIVNSYLPEDIRVFSIRRVTKGFNSKNDCRARTYSYTLPTFALAPELHEEYPEGYRISEETLQKSTQILQSFLGTHPFHNFTVKKNMRDPSAKRYMMDIKAGTPFVRGEEFVTITIKGQSFMLHQIRKMIGYTISILKGMAPPNLETEVWTEKKFSIPLAPGLGLVLENIHYDTYNKRFGNDGMHETLTWDELADEIEKFKNKYILPNIIQKEIEQRLMFTWILSQREHTYVYSEEKEIIEEKVDEISEEKSNDEKSISEKNNDEKLLKENKI